MRRGVAWIVVAPCAVLLFVQCSVPEYGFRDETSAASSSSSGGGEAGATESGVDGSSSSGDSGDVDTGADVTTATDTGVILKPGCSGLPTNDFCSDFDMGALPGIWNGPGAETNGTFALDTTTFTSPQRSVVFTTNALAAGGGIGQVYLQKNFGQATFQTIRLEFDIKVDQVCSEAVTAVIALRDPPERYDLQYAITMPGSRINESNYAVNDAGAFYKQFTATNGPTLGVWTHVIVSAHIPAPSTVSIEQDGALVLAPAAITPTILSGSSSLGAGVAYVAAPSTACKVHMDNVTVRNSN